MSKQPKTPVNSTTYSRKELTGYLIGLAGQNIIYNIIATGLTFYLKSVIFIPVMATSVIFAIARVWDAINDPMMGSIVDKTRTKWGKCKPYLLFVPPIIMVSTILTFCNKMYDVGLPTWQKVLIVGWCGFSYILWGMTYTVGDIPLWGVTSLMTEDQNDRAKILSLARICATFGVLGMLMTFVGSSFKGIFMDKGADEAHAIQYSWILVAVALTVFSSILFEFAGLSVKERVSQSEERYTIKENFKIMFTCKPFRQLLISGVLRSPIQLLSLIAMDLVMYYYFNNNLGGTLMIDGKLQIMVVVRVLVLGIGIFGGMLISSAMTPALTRKFEKKTLYNLYSIGGAIPFALVFVLYLVSGGDLFSLPMTIALGVIFFLASWAQGGLNVLQSVMIADCVDYEEYHRGIRPDGVFFSGQSFITKLSAGIATLISGGVYAAVGFSSNNIKVLNDALLNSGADFRTYAGGKYAMAMFLLVSVPPAIGLVLSAIPTLKYAMSDKEHTRILNELNAKRNSGEAIVAADGKEEVEN